MEYFAPKAFSYFYDVIVCTEAKPKEVRSRFWVYTYNSLNNEKGNYPDTWPKALMEFSTSKGTVYNVTFTCGQEEKGAGDEEMETRGHWHIQGYIELDKDINFTVLKKAFNTRIHWAKRNGTAHQAEHYATKDEDCKKWPMQEGEVRDKSTEFTFGEIDKNQGQGARNDINPAKAIILDPTIKNKKKRLAQDCPDAVVKFHKGLTTLAQWAGISLDDPDDCDEPREVYIIYGPAGTGKTLMARRLTHGKSVYVPQENNSNLISFETYNGEEWILLEDYDPGCIGLGALKRMTDPNNTCVLPSRGSGSSVTARHRGVVITCNHAPESWVDGLKGQEEWNAIKRRCVEIIHAMPDGWIYRISNKAKPPQYPILEAWAKKNGLWRERRGKSRLELIEEEDAKEAPPEPEEAQASQEYGIAQAPQASQLDWPDEQEARYLPLPKKKVVVDLTEDSDSD